MSDVSTAAPTAASAATVAAGAPAGPAPAPAPEQAVPALQATPTAGVEPTPAPAAAPSAGITLTPEQLQALVDGAVTKALAAQAPAAAAAPIPEKPTSPVNLFKPGNLVTHTWFDPYEGKNVTRHGIVLATHPDEGAGARSTVGWLEGPSGPIGDHQLEAS